MPIFFMSGYRGYTDSELISWLQDGNEIAFKTLFECYWERLLHFAAQKTDDFMEAENIVQDVFVSLWNRRTTLNVTTSLNNYLVVSVKYRVIKLLDKKRLQRLYAEKDVAEDDILDDSTQQYLNFEELCQQLEELIAELPEKSALIYRMNKEEEMSHKDIARQLGMTEKAVNARLVRIRKKLRTGLSSFLGGFLL